MEKWTCLRLGREEEGEMEIVLRLQTDGIDSNRRKPYLIGNIPRQTWLIVEKEGLPKKKRMCQKFWHNKLKTDDGRKIKDLEQLLLGTVLGRYQTRQSTTTNNNNNSTVPYSYQQPTSYLVPASAPVPSYYATESSTRNTLMTILKIDSKMVFVSAGW